MMSPRQSLEAAHGDPGQSGPTKYMREMSDYPVHKVHDRISNLIKSGGTKRTRKHLKRRPHHWYTHEDGNEDDNRASRLGIASPVRDVYRRPGQPCWSAPQVSEHQSE